MGGICPVRMYVGCSGIMAYFLRHMTSSRHVTDLHLDGLYISTFLCRDIDNPGPELLYPTMYVFKSINQYINLPFKVSFLLQH